MFLKAGALSLALLLASRVFGLMRESAQAAAFGTSGLADVVVLMLTLPDWLAGVLASGALAYVLVPAWAGQSPAQVAATQRKVATGLLAAGAALALLLILLREPAVEWLAGGLSRSMVPAAANAMVWSALALPAALLAGLWTTRLQHEHDFAGMYSANLVVNAVLIAAIAWAGSRVGTGTAMPWLGAGLLTAMLLRLGWLRWRTPAQAIARDDGVAPGPALPSVPVWLWAVLSAGLPLALPFAARSIASQAGEGALATFNYAWKLVELPLILAIQLVATLAFPAIAKALAGGDPLVTKSAVRGAMALAWTLACASAAALVVGAPAIAQLLFGWGRMDAQGLARVAHWGALGAWGLLPQALIAVALTVLAARGRMKIAVTAYGLALAALLSYAAWGAPDGAALMILLNLLLGAVAIIVLIALGPDARDWLPWRSMAISMACLSALAGVAAQAWLPPVPGLWPGLAAAVFAGLAVMLLTWWGSDDLRAALAR
ncbi:MAG: virulence factor family protein [Ramlibacter sp.]|nr:virulence factor family protein [Ramlibacter sp.]